ncbi:MAG: hypothetical protein HYU99_00155 [Deltaproteobacteria bacterium]|nr:hypothetical protein [Deltaproteobacteria bacterium]
MAKVTLNLPDGTKAYIEGSIEEIKNILSLHGLKKGVPTNLKEKSRSNKAKATGPRGWLRELVEEGFFKQPKFMKNMLEELKSRSHHLKPADLTLSLKFFCHEKKLRRLPKQKGEMLQWVNW